MLLSSCLEDFNKCWIVVMIQDKRKTQEKLMYKQVHSLHCVCSVIQVLLLIYLYFSLNLDACTLQCLITWGPNSKVGGKNLENLTKKGGPNKRQGGGKFRSLLLKMKYKLVLSIQNI